MNVVWVRHGNSKPFAFEVPGALKPYISKGTNVLCSTMRGLQFGTAVTDVISGESILDVAVINGAYLPLKSVVGFANEAYAQDGAIKDKVLTGFIDDVSERLRAKKDEFPF